MSPRNYRLSLALLFLFLLGGCAVTDLSHDIDPTVDLNKLQSFYVIRQPNDERRIEKMIAAELIKHQRQAYHGNERQPSMAVDATITYVDKWMWDITTYLLELTVEIRDPETGYILAKGRSYRTSLARKSPEAMVEEVINTLIKDTRDKNHEY